MWINDNLGFKTFSLFGANTDFLKVKKIKSITISNVNFLGFGTLKIVYKGTGGNEEHRFSYDSGISYQLETKVAEIQDALSKT